MSSVEIVRGCEDNSFCPFLDGPPTVDFCNNGSCLFSDALNSVDSGIMIGQVSSGCYLYMNRYAHEIFRNLPDVLEFGLLLSGLSESGGAKTVGMPSSESRFSRQIIRARGQVIGLTVHLPGGDVAIVTLKCLTPEPFNCEEVTRDHSDVETVVRIFAQLRHEIGNPLNSIKMTLQVLKQSIDSFSQEKIESYIQRTIDEVGRLEKLLVSMREFSRSTSLHIKDLDIEDTLDNFVALVDNECREANFQVKFEVAKGHRFVKADPVALTQILHNLLRNAIQAKKGASGELNIRVKKGKHHQTTLLEFEDRGCGIPRDNLAMVFKPMFTTKTEGTGLGLSVVERLMWKMGGAISVSSEENQYTRFELTLRS